LPFAVEFEALVPIETVKEKMRITVRCDAMRHNKEMRAVSRRAILGVALLAGGIASMDEDCERIRLRKKTSEMTLWATKGKSRRRKRRRRLGS
jgi:hypothetical protein